MKHPENAPPALVEAIGLQTFYGASHVLQGVDFTVARGETVALLGRNGMGRADRPLLRSLTGLTPPRARAFFVSMAKEIVRASPHLVARQGVALRCPRGAGYFRC